MPILEKLKSQPLALARKIVVLIVGVSTLLFGVALLVVPGPAFLVIPLGLMILAAEFTWAKWILDKLKEHARTAGEKTGLPLDKLADAQEKLEEEGPDSLQESEESSDSEKE